jgi:PhoH-like ATPase
MTRAWGLKARNEQQRDALEHLTNPEIDMVILEGVAGSGKTLMAVAAGLQQIFEKRLYNEIVFTRSPVGISEDIGFLPGTEEEKMMPWMGALTDNLEQLATKSSKYDADVIMSKIKVKAIQFMRGRSFANRFVIIDECQNMTPAQMKVLITRAGEGSKFVIMGDMEQIDNRKLNRDNNGLQHIIQRSMDSNFIRIVYLPKGERSRLANFAAEEY